MLLLFLLPLFVRAQFTDPDYDSVINYAPLTNQPCPPSTDPPLMRQFTPQNQTLHPQEQTFIQTRESAVIPQAWLDWLSPENANSTGLGYNLTEFKGRFPRVGLAIPGGGLRAAQYGAAVLNALDSRNDSAKAVGTGGLMQVASYMTGLSGGSWITGSLFFNDWPLLQDLVLGNGGSLSGWLLDFPFASPDGSDVFSDNNQYFYGSVLYSVMAKANAAIYTSITDPWARMISYHFLNQTDRDNIFTNATAHGAGQLWSHILQVPSFQSHLTPFPIAVADSRPVGSNSTTALDFNPVVYEISPLEFGSWDPNLSAMMNLSYTGTQLTNGQPDNDTACVVGFDQAGFVMGSSASLFNQIFDFANNLLQRLGMSQNDLNTLEYVLQRQLRDVRTRADDVANWPNPFTGIKNSTFEDSGSEWLELIDGSSNNENIPYNPLLVNARAVDVIVTIEGSADDPNAWPNGTGIIFSSARQQQLLQSSHRPFPPFPPSADDFESTGVNQRATFFGCDPTQNPPEYPMIIYLPNAPPLNKDDPVTNTATFQLTYTQIQTQLFFDQVYNNIVSGFTPNSNDPDPNFGVCLKCAAVDRARYLLASTIASGGSSSSNATNTTIIPRSDICQTCFDQYCFDPNNPPSASNLPPGRKYVFVDPDPQGLERLELFLSKSKDGLIGGFVGLAAFIAGLVAFLLWWRKKREREYEYQVVGQLHQDEEAPWVATRRQGETVVYEMPEFNKT